MLELTRRNDTYDSKRDEWDMAYITVVSGNTQDMLNELYNINPDNWYQYFVTEFDEFENVLDNQEIEDWLKTITVTSKSFEVTGQISNWSINPHTNGLRWHVQRMIDDASQWSALS